MPNPQTTGKLIANIEGLEIYATHKKAKKNGKDRLYISVRQRNPKKWRISATLGYTKAIDVRFEK